MATRSPTPRAKKAPTKKPPAKKGYHHGSLREALLDAARLLLAKEGADALTLREVARRAGVSHAAPYRHFADKQSLLASVAEEGFRLLTAQMRKNSSEAEGEVEKLNATGLGYVTFALDHPSLYRVMFGAQLVRHEEHVGLQEASSAAMACLIEHVVAGQATGAIRAGDPMAYAGTAWAMVHGLAMGLIDGVFESGICLQREKSLTFAADTLTRLMQGLAR